MLLTIYDLSGIQDFIFSTNKLYEIVGGSYLVSRALFGNVPEVLGDDPKAWETRTAYELRSLASGNAAQCSDDSPGATVYIGGGNALVLFKDERAQRGVTLKLQKLVFEQSGGSLRLCHASVPIDDPEKPLGDYQQAWVEALIRNKATTTPVATAKGFAFNRLENTSYEPILYFSDSDDDYRAFLNRNDEDNSLGSSGFATRSSHLKTREYFEEYRLQFDGQGQSISNSGSAQGYRNHLTECFINQDNTMSHKFMVRFEDAFPDPDSDEAGKRYVAIVHLDGNTMGKRIASYVEGLAESSCDIFESLIKMRNLSKCINTVYQNALRKMVNEAFPPEEPDKPTAFRPIVCDGDDITFITTSDRVFDCLDSFMAALHKESGDGILNPAELTVGIGVVFVPLKYPFSSAYRIAEELCANAKREALQHFGDTPVSSLDFHVCYSELLTDIVSFRNKNYCFAVDGKEYSLVLRPYFFSPPDPVGHPNLSDPVAPEPTSVESLKNNISQFSSSDDPEASIRKALMSMREAYTRGKDAAEQQGRYLKARAASDASSLSTDLANRLSKPFSNDGKALYYDSLDILDLVATGGDGR